MTSEDLSEFFRIQREVYRVPCVSRRGNTTKAIAKDAGVTHGTMQNWISGLGLDHVVNVLNAMENLGYEIKIKPIKS